MSDLARSAAEPAVRVVADDADATRAYGAALAAVLRAGDLVVLTGGLGAGKTTLTQGVGAGLGVRGPVVSPTFTIARVQPSLTGGPALVHVDAYRLGSPDGPDSAGPDGAGPGGGGLDVSAELEALDLDASLDSSVTVVEWGAGWVEALADDRLEVSIERPRGARGLSPRDDETATGLAEVLGQDDAGAAPAAADDASDADDALDAASGPRVITVRGVGSRWSGINLPADGDVVHLR